jgi:hypothetical protein
MLTINTLIPLKLPPHTDVPVKNGEHCAKKNLASR